MPASTNVALRLAETFARHGVTATFGQSPPSVFHLAVLPAGIGQAAYRQENAGDAMADRHARISGILGYRKHAETVNFGEYTDPGDFTEGDHAAIARARGVNGIRVVRGEDVGPALDAAFVSGKPALLDIVADPDAKPPISVWADHYPEPF